AACFVGPCLGRAGPSHGARGAAHRRQGTAAATALSAGKEKGLERIVARASEATPGTGPAHRFAHAGYESRKSWDDGAADQQFWQILIWRFNRASASGSSLGRRVHSS